MVNAILVRGFSHFLKFRGVRKPPPNHLQFMPGPPPTNQSTMTIDGFIIIYPR